MKINFIESGSLVTGALFIILCMASIFGWGMNIHKLTKYDFKPSYEAEIIRLIGVFVAPIGVIAGYVDIEDNAKQ